MPREKRTLIPDDSLDFEEETCRAVKRLHITAAGFEPTMTPTELANPSPGAANSHTRAPGDHETSEQMIDVTGPQGAAVDSPSDISQGTGCLPVQLTDHTICSPVRSTPQRSLSSPDMSRFKFRLCLSKPPIHPTSSGKIRRQLSLEETSIDEDGALAKSTSDRHCEQERLFHQLDQKLTVDLPNLAAASLSDTQRTGPFPVAQPAQPIAASSLLRKSAMPASSSSERTISTLDHTSALAAATDGHEDMLHESSSDGEVCQPSTPIRREDSIPLREDNHQLLGEAVFAAMYEQTNVLLRNLHFERINRRVSTS